MAHFNLYDANIVVTPELYSIPRIISIQKSSYNKGAANLLFVEAIKKYLTLAKINRPNLQIDIHYNTELINYSIMLSIKNIEEARVGELIIAKNVNFNTINNGHNAVTTELYTKILRVVTSITKLSE